MRGPATRTPAAVSALRKYAEEAEARPQRRRFRREDAAAIPASPAVGERPAPANAAVSSRPRAPAVSGCRAATLTPTPTPGPYTGQTDELSPRRVSFRYLGGVIRDLLIGGNLIAEWIPVAAGGAAGQLGDAEVRVEWDDARQAHGSVTRPRAGGTEILHFHARQRFRDYVN